MTLHGCKALSIIISFLVLWSNCLSSLLTFENGPEYLPRGTAQIFISLMRFLLQSLVLKSFLYSSELLPLLLFLSSLFVWWSPFPIFWAAATYYYYYYYYYFHMYNQNPSFFPFIFHLLLETQQCRLFLASWFSPGMPLLWWTYFQFSTAFSMTTITFLCRCCCFFSIFLSSTNYVVLIQGR